MKEVAGDLFTAARTAAAVIIPTNQQLNRNGELVMGAGVARLAVILYPELAKAFNSGEVTAFQPDECPYYFIAVPTKKHWADSSSLELIETSMEKAVALIDVLKIGQPIMLPRLGCGHGGLKWHNVKPVLETLCDDRFVVVHNQAHGEVCTEGTQTP